MQTGQSGHGNLDDRVPTGLGHPAGQTTGTEERASHMVAGGLLAFDLAKECELLHAEDPWQQGDRNAKTLIKQRELRVVLLTLKRGATLETHKADGRVTVHVLSGHARLAMSGQKIDLPAGNLVEISPNVSHDVEAVEESAVLLTVAWMGNA